MNLEVKEETGRPPTATPKRAEVPITRMSSHDAQLQQNLAAQRDQDWRAEGTKKDNDCELSSCFTCREIHRAKTSNTSGLIYCVCFLLGITSEQGKTQLGSLCIEDIHRHLCPGAALRSAN